MAKQYDLLIPLLLLGDTGVGKTCMMCRFTEDSFVSSHITTIGIDFRMKTINIDGKRIKIQIWDTAGQERFESISKQYYRRAMGIFLVYDITNESSFLNISKWLNYAQQYGRENLCLMLVANKCDKDFFRKVPKDKGEQFALTNKMLFSEASALTSENIKQLVVNLARAVIHRNKREFDKYPLDQPDSDIENNYSSTWSLGKKEDTEKTHFRCCLTS